MSLNVLSSETRLRKRDIYRIMYKARKANKRYDCPYTVNTVKWSIWMTAFKYRKKEEHATVFAALQQAGVITGEECFFSNATLNIGGRQ